jgi:hypothetical protein
MPERYKPAREEVFRLKIHQMERDRAAFGEALLIVRQFNARLSTSKHAGFWPTIGTALAANHRWLSVVCESCHGITDIDLSMKPRDSEASIRVVLKDVRCPRCNGHGRPRIIGLMRLPFDRD